MISVVSVANGISYSHLQTIHHHISMVIKLEHGNPNSVGKPTESLPATTSSNTTSAAATFTVKIIKFNSDRLLLYFVSKDSFYGVH